MTNPHLKFQSQSVSRLYFTAAIGLFVGQIVFGQVGEPGETQQARRRLALGAAGLPLRTQGI